MPRLPGIVSSFMLMTMFMGLFPVVLGAMFTVHSPIGGALATFAAFTSAALASALTRSLRPR